MKQNSNPYPPRSTKMTNFQETDEHKKREDTNHQYQMKWDSSTHSVAIKEIIKEYYKQLCIQNFDHLEEA